MSNAYGRRPVNDTDDPLVREIFASSREADFANLPLADSQLDHLIRQQSLAQMSEYRNQYPHAEHDLILVDGQVAGRVFVDNGAHAVHVLDITLLRPYRGRGLGTAVIVEVLSRADERQIPVHLSVAVANNRAQSLYARLGFIEVSRNEVYIAMSRQPDRDVSDNRPSDH